DANGDSVVLNFTSTFFNNVFFNGNVNLAGGLTPDKVIFNFFGGGELSGGLNLTIANLKTTADTSALAQGIFLDPNGDIAMGGSSVYGRVFGGDSKQLTVGGHANITAPGPGATPTLTTTPIDTAGTPTTTVTLPTGPPGTVTLHDSA